jgi:hypothetical protein
MATEVTGKCIFDSPTRLYFRLKSEADSISLSFNRLSNHWKWVIMLVIIVIGIAAIWIGACIWRRRYLKRKDRMYELGGKHGSAAAHSSWGPGLGSATTHAPYGDGVRDVQRANPSIVSAPGMFMPPKAPALQEEKSRRFKEKEKKKWVVTERT